MLKIFNHYVLICMLAVAVGVALGAPMATAMDYANADGTPVDTAIAPTAPQGSFDTSSETEPPEEALSRIPENLPVAEQSQEPTWPAYEVPIEAESSVTPASSTGGNISKTAATQTAIPGSHPKVTEGVLHHFRNFSGERSVKNLVDLFKINQAGIVQNPAIAVSDGITPFVVRLDSALLGATPTFSFRGAHLETLRQLSDGSWELQAIPQKDKYLVYLSLNSGTEMFDIPLTVIPPNIKTEGAVSFSESHVAALLAATEGKEGKLVFDMNHDGKQDYLDDYILIGHYLLNLAIPSR